MQTSKEVHIQRLTIIANTPELLTNARNAAIDAVGVDKKTGMVFADQAGAIEAGSEIEVGIKAGQYLATGKS